MEFAREIAFRFPLCRGDDVRAIQQALTIVQSEPPCGTVDGIFGNATKLAVSEYQRRAGLGADGVVDADTWQELFAAAAARQAQVPKGAASSMVAAAANAVLAPSRQPAGAPQPPADLPVSQAQALRTRDWLFTHFGPQIDAAIAGTPIDAKLVAAIACKETANVWLHWTDRLGPDEVLARCVFDGSGDVPGTPRGAFPRNAAEFRTHAGDTLTDTLIDEANQTRQLRGLIPQRWLYKGYGIFQYDLQHFPDDEEFFSAQGWRRFDACIERLVRELKDKLKASGGDLPDAVRRYNGRGLRAEQYRDHVMYIRGWL